MNLIELLMFEHAAVKLHFRHMAETDTDLLLEVTDFIANCHTRLEDRVLFPFLGRANIGGGTQMGEILKDMENEHTVIRMTGESLREKVARKEALLKDELELYASAVESHNSSEEAHVLLKCMETKLDVERKVIDEAEDVIRRYGVMKYLQVTGVSLELLSSLG